jgi:assimilatory nitrate reductase catalytic subunit
VDPWLVEQTRPAGWTSTTAPRFPTVTGKIEIASSLLPRFGLPALPALALSEPPSTELPLRLVTGQRQRAYINSQFHPIPRITRLVPKPLVELHKTTAARVGIVDSQRVRVITERGHAVFVARVTDAVLPDVAVVPRGWPGEANAKLFTSLDGRDPISGFPRLRGLACRVEPA